ncbi:membrane hypothetical protein [Gammaproteobacteria bacterium]
MSVDLVSALITAALFLRLIMYPLIGFGLLTLAFSANKAQITISYRLHIALAMLFFTLGIMAMLSYIGKGPDTLWWVERIKDVFVTPILMVVLAYNWIAVTRTEKNFIQKAKEKLNGCT